MKVVIIEDEMLTAEDLAEILINLADSIEIVKTIGSVRESVDYFKSNRDADLILSDIQLGDGYSFDIFKQVKIETPVIFCTAFNTYAIEAFKNNGIDYVLKPFTQKTIKAAIDKYKSLKAKMGIATKDYEAFLQSIQNRHYHDRKLSSLLVSWKDKIIPVKVEDIALLYIEYRTTKLVTYNNQKYSLNNNLEELEEICGEGFYRANRQYLINRKCISEASHYGRKLILKLKVGGDHDILISKNRVPEFLSWLRM